MSAVTPGHSASDRTQTVLQLAPPAAHHQPGPVKDDGVRWMKRFLNGEYDRWMLAKRLLNVEEDHVIVKVLLDFFQSHGGFDGGASETESGAVVSRQLVKRDTPSTGRSEDQQADPASPPDTGPDSPPSCGDEPSPATVTPAEGHGRSATNGRLRRQNDDEPSPATVTPAEEHGRSAINGRLRRQNGRRVAQLKKTRAAPVVAAVAARPAPVLPSIDPQLMPLFSCGLCGTGHFPDLAAHFEHLWSAHTELRMLGSAQRRRVPLKLRPHMFVLCALCGLNNRSTSTAGAADRHLTRAHLPARHQRALQATATGPLRFDCDECETSCESRAELAMHALDAGHSCAGFACDACGAEGEGEANVRHHRLWHRAAMPFQCYLCAERFATEPECVAHVRAEHAASFNVHRCARCPYATSIVGQFIAHARSHVGLNACVCHECGVMFQTAQSLRRHLLTHAWSEFRCQHCDKSFRHPLPLERHVRSQHVSPEDHKCGACSKLFTSRYHLERHALIHSGRRPHQCDMCGRGFVQKGDLVRHVRRCRVLVGGEKPHPPPPPAAVTAKCPPPPPPIAPPPPPPPPHSAPPSMAPLPVQPQPFLLPPPPPAMTMALSVQGAG